MEKPKPGGGPYDNFIQNDASINPGNSGVIIIHVETGSQADQAGLSPGDIIVEVDKKAVKDLANFNRLLAGIKDGETLLFLVDRDGTTIFVTLTVEK